MPSRAFIRQRAWLLCVLLALVACRGPRERNPAFFPELEPVVEVPYGEDEAGAAQEDEVVGGATEGVQIPSEPPAGWAPGPPNVDGAKDWIRLVSDEWLRGEIRSLYRYTLEFESDELDVLTLDFADIKEVRTNRPFSVLLANRQVVTGIVNILEDRVVIRTETGQIHTQRTNVTRMVSGSPREADHWSAKVSLGATVRSGNTDQLDTTTTINARRRTANSRIDMTFLGAYSEVQSTKTVDNERFNGSYDLYVGPRLYITAIALELFRDPFQNIEFRAVPATGVGVVLIDTSKLEWEVTLGVGYRYTAFDSVGEGEPDSDSSGNALVGTSFETDLTKKLELDVDYSAQIGMNDLADTNQNLTAVFSFDVWKDLDFDVTFVWSRVGQPAEDENGQVPERDDYRLGIGLGWEF